MDASYIPYDGGSAPGGHLCPLSFVLSCLWGPAGQHGDCCTPPFRRLTSDCAPSLAGSNCIGPGEVTTDLSRHCKPAKGAPCRHASCAQHPFKGWRALCPSPESAPVDCELHTKLVESRALGAPFRCPQECANGRQPLHAWIRRQWSTGGAVLQAFSGSWMCCARRRPWWAAAASRWSCGRWPSACWQSWCTTCAQTCPSPSSPASSTSSAGTSLLPCVVQSQRFI